MLFDDRVPFASVLDVVAHELTHAVTDESSDLIYQGQSGALNESMSDIFGEMVEARTYGRNDWLMAAELEPYGLGPMRSLSDPNSISTRFGPYPARMSQYVDTPDDNGGVHINSSIINHAFYLLAEGLSGAIGLDAAAQIFYRANTVYLTPSAQFSDARELVIQSADDIFGPSSVQSRVTAEAFDAVEIFGDNPPPPPPGDDEFEENDSLSSAAGISGGTLSLRGKDDDWFRVRVGPGRMTIRVSGPEGDLDLAVTDLNGNLLGASTSTSSVETISREETQTVERLILVHPYGGASSDYQLTVDVPPGCEGGCDDTGGGLCGNGCAMAMFASFAGLLGFSGIERRRVRT
jgi:hypothetical protein